MSVAKIFRTLAIVCCLGVLVFAGVVTLITHSVVYDIGKREIASQFNVAAESVSLRWYEPMEIVDGDENGEAKFVLCGGGHCYDVAGKKRQGRWAVSATSRL
jgi:hypothetical protein